MLDGDSRNNILAHCRNSKAFNFMMKGIVLDKDDEQKTRITAIQIDSLVLTRRRTIH
jgi:hypothetical protein